ncbi:hypothetical protein [Burkholderia phage FLC8]|nr:hypothetical protein [Burkholderia phage FLC8]
MLSIFNDLQPRMKGIISFPEWTFIRDGLMMNLDHTNKYYRSGAYAVGSDHELVKLLFGLTTSTDEELATYYKRVDAKALTVAQQLGFTTSISKGRMFNNVFFSGKSREVIIVHNEDFDPQQVTENWRDARPIQILRHGFDFIDCFPMQGQLESSGVSCFAINLSMLGVQYRAYRQWQKSYVTEETGRNSVYHFLFAYPLNNMIYDAMDHAVFNRLVRLNQNLPTSDNQYRHPFHVTNFVGRVDRILGKVLDTLRNNPLDFYNICATIPLINQGSLLDLLKLPDIYESRQINWAIYMARIDMLLFLLSFDNNLKMMNQSELSKIKYALKLYLKDGTIQSAVPHDLFGKQKIVIERLVEKM